MKRTAAILIALFCSAALALGQATIVVSGTKVNDNNGNLLTGNLIFIVTDNNGQAISYTPQGGSPTTAQIVIPVKRGVVQNVNGFPPTIPYPATMSPANTRYTILVQSADTLHTYLTLPYTNITQPFFSYDNYAAPADLTGAGAAIVVHGLGFPKLPCVPKAEYTNDSSSDTVPWICSQLPNNTIYWTQNPSQNPACQGTAQAAASPAVGTIFCVDSQQAYVTPGLVFAGPSSELPQPGPLSVTRYAGGASINVGGNVYHLPYLAPGLTSLTGSGIYTDATGNNLTVPGAVANGSSVNSTTQDYVNPGHEADAFPLHYPWNFIGNYFRNSPVGGGNDEFQGIASTTNIWSGTFNFNQADDYMLNCGGAGCTSFQDVSAIQNNIKTNSPIQGGGAFVSNLNAMGEGDDIYQTLNLRYQGPGRLTDEGAEYCRCFLQPSVQRWGGTITSLTSSDSNGNVGIQVAQSDGGDATAPSEQTAPVINTSRGVGAVVTDVRKWTVDNRLYRVTFQNAVTGNPSVFTTLTQAVDSGIYTGCPSTQNGWYSFNPFPSGPTGLDNSTQDYCWTVVSTTGMNDGDVFTASSGQFGEPGITTNFEVSKIKHVVDGTHFIADAKQPHGQLTRIGVGGLAGYAGGFTVDIQPVGALQNSAALYLTPVIAGCDTISTCILAINIMGGGYNSFGYDSNTPVTAATVTPVVVGGDVTSITVNTGGNYHTNHAAGIGMQVSLSPPTVTVSGCTINPTFHSVLMNAVVTSIVKDTGGSGCTTPTVTLETQWPNAFTIYPAFLTYKGVRTDGSGNVIKNADGTPVLNGYELAEPLAGTFQVGDHVLGTTWPAQAAGSQITIRRNLGWNSGWFGDIERHYFAGFSGGSSFRNDVNQDNPSIYYGTQATNWQHSESVPGSSFTTAPNLRAFTGAYGTGFVFDNPPLSALNGPNQTTQNGTLFQVNCATRGGSFPQPCSFNFNPPFRVFAFASGPGFSTWVEDPKTGNWEFGTPRVQFDGAIVVNTTITSLHQPYRYMQDAVVSGSTSGTFTDTSLIGSGAHCQGNVAENSNPSATLLTTTVDLGTGIVTSTFTASTTARVNVSCNVP